MPPRQTFTKEKIVDAALNLMRREGIEKLTARSIAKELGSSTMPVYSTIESMEKLKELIFERSLEIAAGFRAKYKTGDVMTNYALGHILLAKEERMLYRLVWMDDSWDRSIIGGLLKESLSVIHHELLAEDKYRISSDIEEFTASIYAIWMIIRGIAVEVNLGSFAMVPDTKNFISNMTDYVSDLFDSTLHGILKH